MGLWQWGLQGRSGLWGADLAMESSSFSFFPFNQFHLSTFCYFFFSFSPLSWLLFLAAFGLFTWLSSLLGQCPYIFLKREDQASELSPGRSHPRKEIQAFLFSFFFAFFSHFQHSQLYICDWRRANKQIETETERVGHKVRTSGRLARKFTCLSGFRLHILCCLETSSTVSFHALFSPIPCL